MKNPIVIGVIGVVIGVIIGYSVTGSNSGSSSADAKKIADSVVMMKDQETGLKQMAEVMKANGSMMQDMGMKYKDDGLVNGGKDMLLMSEKYMKTMTATGTNSTMNKMMGN